MRALTRAFLLAAVCVSVTGAARAQDTTINRTYARDYFAQLRRLGDADGARLWGRRVDGAMMFVDPESRRIEANAPDSAGLLTEHEGLWSGTLPQSVNIANTAMRWSGRRWSMIIWPLPDDRYARGRLLMHESFHRLQPEMGVVLNDVTNSHMSNVDARVWLRLEMRALAEALLRSGAARQQALRDALTFRARRRAQFADAAHDEQQLELNEGLAEYTGLRLSGLPLDALPDRAAAQLANAEQRGSFSRNFAYATGPAYGLLLDAVDSTWRTRVAGTTDLGDLAAAAHRIGALNPARADSLIARYDGQRMVAEERAAEVQRLAREQQYRSTLIDGPTMSFPVAGAFSYSFNPNGATPLEGVGVVYDAARVTDSWGVLTVTSGGILLRRANGLIVGIAVPVPASDTAPMKGDGWTLELAPGWRVERGPRASDWTVKRAP